jgi:hypothetical protein
MKGQAPSCSPASEAISVILKWPLNIMIYFVNYLTFMSGDTRHCAQAQRAAEQRVFDSRDAAIRELEKQ